MPHVIVKMFPGRTPAQKQAVADAITQALITTLGSKPASISVGIEDIAPDAWDATVKTPDILGKPETIFKQPG